MLASQTAPTFERMLTEESLWLDGWYNPPWVDEEQRSSGLKAIDVRNEEDFHAVNFEIVSHIVRLLKACEDLGKGFKLHAYIREHTSLMNNQYVASTLISMYGRCGALADAQQAFNELPVAMRDVVIWTALIAGYGQQGQGEEALKWFDRMQSEGHSPNAVTLISALKACGSIGAVAKIEQIHDMIVSLGILEENIMLGSTLVDMYARCGALVKAQRVFDKLPVRNVVTWTALIAGYIQQGLGDEALECLDFMQRDGHSPNAVTYTCALKACGSIGALVRGEQIHEKIVSTGILKGSTVLGNTLLDMYVKCGAFAKAQQVFDELPVRNVVTWTALIAGHAQEGKGDEALNWFDYMQCEGHFPNAITFTCALKACGTIGAVARGEKIRDKIVVLGMLERDPMLGNTLMDMYARCGILAMAQEVFDELPVRNVVVWTALLAGYAQQGQGVEALDCLEKMLYKGVRPNQATFICVLNACSHSGLVDEAETYFSGMSTEYGISPDLEHYCCMVDLLGRAGKLGKAVVEIEKMSFASYPPAWFALLGACRKWQDIKVAWVAFQRSLHLHDNDAAAYVCMANICNAAGI